MSGFRIGIGVGGTFTDVVGIAADGAETLAKAASTPQDQSEGVLAGLENLAAALGLPLAELLGRTARIVHGTTVATNALLERRGARVASRRCGARALSHPAVEKPLRMRASFADLASAPQQQPGRRADQREHQRQQGGARH